MPLTLETAPVTTPVSLQDVKDHSRIDTTDDDTYLTTLIDAATSAAEIYCKRRFITQTWNYYLDDFQNSMEIPNAPLQSVTSISYTDTNGDPQTLGASIYDVDAFSDPGFIRLAYGQSWPAVRNIANAVTIVFKCGYGDAATAVPDGIKHAVKMYASHFYENREPVLVGATVAKMPMTIEHLLSPYRVDRF